MSRMFLIALASALVVTGCEAGPEQADAEVAPVAADPQQVWWERMQELCGEAFAGRMVRYDEAMHVRECSADEIRIPLHVGENRSRTWVLTRTGEGIRLKHDHRYPDGTEEVSSQYGGTTTDAGTPERQEFPAGEYSRQLFERTNHPDGVQNVWIMEIHPGEKFVYNLIRFNRDFAAEFDLTSPVDPPPPPWAVQPEPDAGSDSH
jgi:hypothetical protein